jgi:hypothetical protein
VEDEGVIERLDIVDKNGTIGDDREASRSGDGQELISAIALFACMGQWASLPYSRSENLRESAGRQRIAAVIRV